MSIQIETEIANAAPRARSNTVSVREERAIEAPQNAGRPRILARRQRRWERRSVR